MNRSAVDDSPGIEEFGRKHRTGLLTLLFTDIVGSGKIKQVLGDNKGVALIQQHHAIIDELLSTIPDSREMDRAGDSFFLTFARPSDAVRFALLQQSRLRAWSKQSSHPVQDRIGIHIGEVIMEQAEGAAQPKHLFGAQVDTCARVMSLGQGDQILLTRAAFDNARQALRGEELDGIDELQWLNHGPYLLKGLEEPMEICEVGESGLAWLRAPADAEKARRQVSPDTEPVLGWRPALGQVVPNTKWVLEQKLGEGGFGEVWLARHQTMKERRVFKFCFQAERIRFLKRELTLFRLLKERIGDHPNIVGLREVNFDQPPFYVEMEYVEGRDLRSWCEGQGGVEKVPPETRLEIIAQAADGLQAAHDAGIIHRDIKPANILISDLRFAISDFSETNGKSKTQAQKLMVKLTDFGIGQVVSEEVLAGITRAGFTQTVMAESSSSHTGTQLYMAPELLAGKPGSIRSDIYSLGVVLYQLLVSDLSRPLTTDWAGEIADPLLRDDLKHCFAGNPQDRFAGAGQLARQLRLLEKRKEELAAQQAAQEARERSAYRRGIIRTAAVAASVVAVMALLAAHALNQSRLARNAAQKETQQRERAEQTAHRLKLETYAADMRVAFISLQEQNLGRAVELLRKHLPQPGEEDLRGFEWRYLWQQCRGDELASFKDGGIVSAAVFSADGRLIATASYSGTVKIWDVATRTLLKIFDGFPPDYDRNRNYAAFSPEGKWFAAWRGHQVVVWDTSTWNEITTLPGHAAPLMFSPDGSVLAGWGRTGLHLWNTQRWEPEAIAPGVPYRRGSVMAFCPDSRIFAVATSTNVEVWSVRSPTNVATFTFPSPSSSLLPDIRSLAISKNRILAAGQWQGAVKLWNLSTRREITVTNLHPRTVYGLAFSPDGKVLASASADQTVKLWNVETLSIVSTLRGHEDEVWSVAFASNGRSLLSGSKDGTAKIWSASPKPQPELIPGGDSFPDRDRAVGFSADGKFFIVKTNVSLKYWEISSGRLAKTRDLSSEPGFAAIKDRLAMAPVVARDGQTLALARQDGSVHVLDLATMALTPTTLSPQIDLKDLTDRLFFSRDGRVLCLRNENRTNLWVLSLQVEIPIPRDCLVENRIGFGSVALSPDGKMLAGPSTNYIVKLWDASTGRELRALKGHAWILAPPLFSPNGRFLATMGNENSARLWNVANGTETVLKGHKQGGLRADFSPDSRTFAASSGEDVTKLWNVDTGQEIVSFDFAHTPLFSPDGNTLALQVPDGNFRLVRVPSRAEIDATEMASPGRK